MSYLVQQNRTENLLSESRVRLNPCLKKKIMSLFNRCLLFISGTVLGMRDMEIDVLR